MIRKVYIIRENDSTIVWMPIMARPKHDGETFHSFQSLMKITFHSDSCNKIFHQKFQAFH